MTTTSARKSLWAIKVREGKKEMKPTQELRNMGQSLWLDNITRSLLRSGTLRRYRDDFSITGLTSNPSIFDHAIKNSNSYDEAIGLKRNEGKSAEELFFDLDAPDALRRPLASYICATLRTETSFMSNPGAQEPFRCSRIWL